VTSPTTTDEKRCPRCGRVYPRTAEHFYFDYRGRVVGYCKSGGCHAAYNQSRVPTPAQRAMHREVARNWWRRHRRPPPERQRGLRVETPS